MSKIPALPIAVRVFPEMNKPAEPTQSGAGVPKRWRQPDAMLVFDTETTVDETQRLTFGSYRFFLDGECQEEGLFYAPDLPSQDVKTLSQYSSENVAEASNRRLK